MNEKPADFVSAEQELVIEPETGYFRAQRFAHDPVLYFKAFRDMLIEGEYSQEEFGIQAIGEIHEIEEIISNEDVPVVDERVAAMLVSEYGSKAWAECVFGILKDAGFIKEQLLLWLAIDDDEFSPEERMKERALRVHLLKVFEG